MIKKKFLLWKMFKLASQQKPADTGFQTTTLYFTKGEDFISVDPLNDRYEWISLYIMNKSTKDALHINFRAGRAML
ncbi:hypothetical protein RZN08_18400 [Bacillus paralicheniformis]|nr:hypothetical protein RZN08_18400 [Bacillus paralicheniformis]